MQRFTFRLAGLLRLRTQLEQTARRSLATAMGAVSGVEQRLVVANEGLRECEQLGCSNEPHAPLARALASGLARHRLGLQNELRAAEARLDRARGDWIEQRKDQRTLTLLRDRQRDEWRHEQEAREQRELEELTQVQRLQRRTQEEGT